MNFTNKKNQKLRNQSRVIEAIDQRKLHDHRQELDLLQEEEFQMIRMNSNLWYQPNLIILQTILCCLKRWKKSAET